MSFDISYGDGVEDILDKFEVELKELGYSLNTTDGDEWVTCEIVLNK